MSKTFQQYLMGKCMGEEVTTDDTLVDIYEGWIQQQDLEDVIDWAERWGKLEIVKAEQRAWKEAKKLIEGLLGGPTQ